MSEWIDKRVGKFSKGMKQRICIASALLNDPSVIIPRRADLRAGPEGMSEVRDIVKSLKNKNRLIFMSSHILNEVADICDEVAMIDHGKLLVYDTLSKVTAKFSGGETVLEVGFSRPVSEDCARDEASRRSLVVASAKRKDEKNLVVVYSGEEKLQEQVPAAGGWTWANKLQAGVLGAGGSLPQPDRGQQVT